MHTRRGFLAMSLCGLAASAKAAAPERAGPKQLEREVGITTSSLSRQLVLQPRPGKLTLLELPRVLRDELDMRVIDLNTSSLASFEPAYLERLRDTAEKAGCVLTNLKMNQPGLDLGSPDAAVREKALAEYRRAIDAAAHLGLRWARPLPNKNPPHRPSLIAALKELAEYAGRRQVQLLVENYGWMEFDPHSVVRLIEAVGGSLAACPDTGNWIGNEVRYEGLAKTFPLAVTCDFKARDLGPGGEHPLYDLKRCFTLGWNAGFRGPWCLEHAHADQSRLFRELALLRDSLRTWMAR
jgi:hypothetical protein